MKKIRRYLLSIFLILLSIYILNLRAHYDLSLIFAYIEVILPIAAILVLVPNFFEKDD